MSKFSEGLVGKYVTLWFVDTASSHGFKIISMNAAETHIVIDSWGQPEVIALSTIAKIDTIKDESHAARFREKQQFSSIR